MHYPSINKYAELKQQFLQLSTFCQCCILVELDPLLKTRISLLLLTFRLLSSLACTLEEVLKRLSDAGLRLKVSKCQFMKSSLDCLGHHIDKDGFHPVAAKVNAIKDAPAPIVQRICRKIMHFVKKASNLAQL